MIQLNLLPDVKKEYLKSQKTKALVMSSAVLITLAAVGLAVLLFIYVTFVQQIQINIVSDDIKRKSQQLNSTQDISKYLTIQNQLKALPELHNQKGMASRLFTFLPILNPGAPNNVNLSVLNFTSADNSILLNGTTSSFESLDVFVDTLSNAEVTYKPADSQEAKTERMFPTVSVQSSGLARVNNVSTVSFSITLNYAPAVFDAQSRDVTAKVPNIQTTQSIAESPLFEGGSQ